MRALEGRAERHGPSTSSLSKESMNIREELKHAETHKQKVTVRLDPGNPSEPERDGTQRNASPVPELVRALCCWSSDCDVSEARMDCSFRDRNADSEWDFANVLVRKHGCN